MKIEPKSTDIVVPAKNVAVVGPTIKTHNDGFSMWDACSGSSLMGYIDISYAELVAKFGEPGPGDEYKVDAEWEISDGTRHAIIYNYKDGKSYDKQDGLKTSDIRDWHIGGNATSGSVDLLKDLFPNHRVKDGY